MIKRSKTKSKYSNRKRADRANKKRRLTMEGLEKRQLLAAEVFLPNVISAIVHRSSQRGGSASDPAFESERLRETGNNDTIFRRTDLPLGTAPGKRDTIDLRGSLPVTAFTERSF